MHKFAEQIVQCVKSKVEARGIDNVQPAELEEVSKWVEMARDLVAYDKDMRIVKAMDEEEKYDEMEMRMGYSGSGNGGNSGSNYGNRGNSGGGSQSDRAGYDGGGYGYNNERMNGSGDSRYGRSYNQYKNSRRGYTETHSPEHQQKMKESISEIFNDMEEMVTDIWKDVEPAEKQKYKTKMQQMLQKMQ